VLFREHVTAKNSTNNQHVGARESRWRNNEALLEVTLLINFGRCQLNVIEGDFECSPERTL
jgi:hypothetical protein